MRNLHLLPLVFLVAPILAGCPALDAIEGKPSSQEAYERRQAVLMEPVSFVEPPTPEPPCYEEFRVRRCVDGVGHDYWTGEPL